MSKLEISKTILEERVEKANFRGDIKYLERIFIKEKLLDILEITEEYQWNWLHRCNLGFFKKSPPRTINFYIRHGVPVNAQDCYGMTPLSKAMGVANAGAAIVLLNAGADPNIPSKRNITPLSQIGIMPNKLNVLRLMLQKGGNVHYVRSEDSDESILESFRALAEYEPHYKPFVKLMEKYA
ncbi:ankyrin repeat domain-containing protein [Volucribacter psittacicida]|nr:ankyrin repeat domain-containing protein [Volucribacter psittacicida]